jgi:hypothetical protein
MPDVAASRKRQIVDAQKSGRWLRRHGTSVRLADKADLGVPNHRRSGTAGLIGRRPDKATQTVANSPKRASLFTRPPDVPLAAGRTRPGSGRTFIPARAAFPAVDDASAVPRTVAAGSAAIGSMGNPDIRQRNRRSHRNKKSGHVDLSITSRQTACAADEQARARFPASAG